MKVSKNNILVYKCRDAASLHFITYIHNPYSYLITQKAMENENKSAWGKILKVIITVLTAVATTFGLQACI